MLAGVVSDGEVVVLPPVEVMRPELVSVVPSEDALPGGVQFSLKVDGFRCAAFQLDDRVVLQSRSARDLAKDFPEVAVAVAKLPVGTVLDGELCAVVEGRFAFHQLLRSRAARVRDRVPVSLLVWDVLAVPGRDVRDLPLADRWESLREVMVGADPRVQLVAATTDRAMALCWYQTLAHTGIEGLVCRSLASAYRPRPAGRGSGRWAT
jgi:ATP-dependent DNA ligase